MSYPILPQHVSAILFIFIRDRRISITHDFLYLNPLYGGLSAEIGRIVSKQAKVTVPPKSPSTPGRDRQKTVTLNNKTNAMNNHVNHDKENAEDVEMDVGSKEGIDAINL